MTEVKLAMRGRAAARLECPGQGHHGAIAIETLKAWQCVGCGRLEGPQNCIGVCRDRKVELVYASELAEAEARTEAARAETAALRALLLKIASTKPRDGQWEKSWRSFQDEARALLARQANEPAAVVAATGGVSAGAPAGGDAIRAR
ncbi:MAG: hypothetical protein HS109_18365 [Burkholderiales bacterium]|nr:hypothetical protein [Burkholderiales bacterium]